MKRRSFLALGGGTLASGLLLKQPLLYAPSVGVPPERQRENLDAMLDVFGGDRA